MHIAFSNTIVYLDGIVTINSEEKKRNASFQNYFIFPFGFS